MRAIVEISSCHDLGGPAVGVYRCVGVGPDGLRATAFAGPGPLAALSRWVEYAQGVAEKGWADWVYHSAKMTTATADELQRLAETAFEASAPFLSVVLCSLAVILFVAVRFLEATAVSLSEQLTAGPTGQSSVTTARGRA